MAEPKLEVAASTNGSSDQSAKKQRWRQRNKEIALVVFVLFIIIYAAVTCNLSLLRWDPHIFFHNQHGVSKSPIWKANLIETMVLDIFVVLLLWMYLTSVLMDPGGPRDWVWERPDQIFPPSWIRQNRVRPSIVRSAQALEQPESPQQQQEEIRLCSICKTLKADRVHHCSQCNKCILALDHHCIWTANCLGQRNHKFFVLFLFYVTVATSFGNYLFVVFLYRAYKFYNYYPYSETVRIGILVYFGFLISFSVSMAVGGLCVRQIYLACRNMTNLEHIQSKSGGRYKVKSYNRGMFLNLVHSFGPSVWLWLLPCSRHGELPFMQKRPHSD